MSFGLINWGTGFWGLAAQPPNLVPPAQSNINVIDVIPAPGSFNISRSQTFTFTIKSKMPNGDPGFAINTNSIYIFLDNQTVVQGTTVSSNFAVVVDTNIDGISLDYQITPNYLFNDSAVFTLQVYATDIHGNPSYPFWAGYVVEDTRPDLITPIYPLDGYADVPVELSLHFLINQLAAPDAGLDASSLSIYVNDNPAVVDGNIQSAFDGTYSTINLPTAGDITTPFELVLDSTGRYAADEIVTVKASIKSITIPVVDGYATFLDKFGLTARDPDSMPLSDFAITAITKISDYISQVTLEFDGDSPVADGYVTAGFRLKNTNDNEFRILDIIDGYTINVETLPKTLRGSFTFVTTRYAITPPTPVFAGYFQGVYLVDNLGDGYHINVTWHPARTSRADNDLAYLVYYSTTRSDVFHDGPKLITQGRRLTAPELIHGADAQLFGFFAQIPLPVGVTYYFGVRATEFAHTALPAVPPDGYGMLSDGLTVVDGYSFSIPAQQLLMEQVTGSGSVVIPVTSTAGYATAGGYITVGAEIMRYTSLDETPGFVVSSNGRGLFGSTIQPTHNSGEYVRMYYGNYDDNSVIAKNLVSWETPHDSHRTRPDLITTDFTLEDGYHASFEPFDYCGYHRYRPDELLSDQQCNSYVGGEYNGQRGLNLYDRTLAREEQLLEVTGEPTILLKRVWSGEICICRTSRKDSAAVRSCAICFGVGFKSGYIQYSNPRRADHRIMVHFAPSDEDLGMGAQAGWDQKFKPGTWTLAVPSVKDRDVLIRFDEYGQMDWIYTVNSVSRAKVMFGQSARQKLVLSRLDKTDVLYQFKAVK